MACTMSMSNPSVRPSRGLKKPKGYVLWLTPAMRRPRARILAMKEPWVTRGGLVGRKLLAVGWQGGVGCATARAGRYCRAATAADPGTAQAVVAATSSTDGSISRAGGLTGIPPIGWQA